MNGELSRSRYQAVIGGVCAGLGLYLAVDPAFVRIFFLLLVLGNGIGVLLYFLLWIIMPLDGQLLSLGENVQTGSHEIAQHAIAMGEDLHDLVRRPVRGLGFVIIVAVIIFCVIYLLGNLPHEWARWFRFDLIWPLLLIFGGMLLLLRRSKGE